MVHHSSDENPYVRLRKLCGAEQKDFAAKYGLAKTTMTYIESGQYPSLSEKMILSLGQECYEKGVPAKEILASEYAAADLNTAYQGWQRRQRLHHAEVFRIDPPERWNKTTSPMHSYISATTGSVQSFCKTLKVPAASVHRYATGATRSMPAAVETALRQVGFLGLAKLLAMQENWNTERS